jgi:hypothetical protein
MADREISSSAGNEIRIRAASMRGTVMFSVEAEEFEANTFP